MKSNAFILGLLFLAGLAAAFTVNPDYIGIKDTGNGNLPTLDVAISIDCDTKDVHIDVASAESEEPVEGAMTYLFYTDYSYQALPNPGKTDGDGRAMIPVPGTIRFLNALFILRVDKTGFQSREIEFAYEKCFKEPPAPPPAENASQNVTNQTAPPPQNATPPANATPPTNASAPPPPPAQNGTPAPEPTKEPEPAQSACPAAIMGLIALLAFTKRG